MLDKSRIHFYVFIFLALSLLYLIGIYLIFRHRATWGNSKRLVFIIIIFAVLFRVLLVPAAPTVLSGDMYRYIWDGRVQQNGINPYRHPPDATELIKQRDDQIYPNINRGLQMPLSPAHSQSQKHPLYRQSDFGFPRHCSKDRKALGRPHSTG